MIEKDTQYQSLPSKRTPAHAHTHENKCTHMYCTHEHSHTHTHTKLSRTYILIWKMYKPQDWKIPYGTVKTQQVDTH